MKSSMKKVAFVLSVCIMFVMEITCYSIPRQCKIFVNQKELTTSSQPFNRSGRIMVPMRDIFEALDMNVNWNPKERRVTANKPNYNIELSINSKVAKVNGKAINLDVPATIKQGKTFVPVRFIAESLNMDVSWNGNNKYVMISSLKDSKNPASIITNTPTPIITNTPTFATINTSIPSEACTPKADPSYVPADINLIIDGSEFKYKELGDNSVVTSDGVIYGNIIISVLLGIEFDHQSDQGYHVVKLKRKSDGTYLKTKVVDRRWFPIIEAAREINYQVEFKNNVLTINSGNSNGDNESFFLDQTIPVNVSTSHYTVPIYYQGDIPVLSTCRSSVTIIIQKEEGFTRLKSLDDSSVKKILFDFYQNSTSLKQCGFVDIFVLYNGNNYFWFKAAEGHPIEEATLQRFN